MVMPPSMHDMNSVVQFLFLGKGQGHPGIRDYTGGNPSSFKYWLCVLADSEMRFSMSRS
jgi:hypothetical protein